MTLIQSRRWLAAGLVLALLLGCVAAFVFLREPAAPPAAPAGTAGTPAQRIEADVRFLADDLLEGREAGTRGYALASLYVAERMRAAGLEPAGENGGWYQRVPLLRATRVGGDAVIERDGTRTTLGFLDGFYPALNFNDDDAQVTAPAVFVGQGVHAPELGHDDFRGIDLRGRIAVMFYGAPATFDHDRRAFHSSTREKFAELVRRGAVGVLFVSTPTEEKRRPWARDVANWARPGMRLRGADGRGVDTFPQLEVVGFANVAHTARILGRDPAPLYAALDAGTLAPFAIPGTLTLSARTRTEPAESRNVVGRLRGGDAALRGEHVAFTAHLDHVGIGAPVDGDAIYNGALDNALGVAVMLEAAQQLAARAPASKRSLLFIALTAEEKGLLGAEWFVRQPTVPRDSIVANVNMDMPVLLAPTRDVMPIGLEHSSLAPLVEQAAKEVGVGLSADPFPEEVVFVRSDQYAFIRAGIPAVYLTGGIDAHEGDGKQRIEGFLAEHYHQPGDDADQPIQYADAARLARLNAMIGARIANAPERPRWNAGDFFGERFGGR